MLHFERKRQKAIAEAETKGMNLWTGTFEEAVRVKIFHALQDAADGLDASMITCDAAQRRLIRALGKHRLTNLDLSEIPPTQKNAADYVQYVHECSDAMMPSVIEAAFVGLRAAGESMYGAPGDVTTENFRASVKTILEHHRISWDVVGNELIERKSQALHAGVIEPAVRLLAGRKDLAAVEHAFQEALREVSKGTPEDAITDAGTALQEMLTACGCQGNQLGDLATDARKKDLLAPHDGKLVDWVAADRSQKGDSHRVVASSKEDAWLMIYVVGALIVRLAAGKR